MHWLHQDIDWLEALFWLKLAWHDWLRIVTSIWIVQTLLHQPGGWYLKKGGFVTTCWIDANVLCYITLALFMKQHPVMLNWSPPTIEPNTYKNTIQSSHSHLLQIWQQDSHIALRQDIGRRVRSHSKICTEHYPSSNLAPQWYGLISNEVLIEF